MTCLSTLLAFAALLAPPSQAPDAEFVGLLTPLEGTTPAQWRIVWTEAPDRAATVSWTTREPGTTHRVLYEPASAPDDDGFDLAQTTHRDGAYTRHPSDQEPATWFHHARLQGLSPATTYRLRLESDGVLSRVLTFQTAPADERPFTLLSGGDSRSGWRERCFMNLALAALVERDASLLALSHGGDYVMLGDRYDHWSKWLSHQELCTTSDGRLLPLVPTRGNHDYGPGFDEVFDAPGAAGRTYYETRIGPTLALFTLDSNIPVAGDQLTWLGTGLEEAFWETRWLLASYHRPLYPAVKPPGDAKNFWPPLFDAFELDLALESDGHCMKRTVPIRDDKPDPAGTVYVGEGGLGVPQRNPREDRWYLAAPGFARSGHHVLRLDVSPTALDVRFLELRELPVADPAAAYDVVVPPGANWNYLAADDAPAGWQEADFDDGTWAVSPAGFGYGDEDDATVLDQMRGQHARVHVRKRFDGTDWVDERELLLLCRYDDAFIAYLNGVEVARSGITPDEERSARPRVSAHEARGFETFPLELAPGLVHPGPNVLALVGYNRMRGDADFSLDPWLAAGKREVRPAVPELIEGEHFRLLPRER